MHLFERFNSTIMIEFSKLTQILYGAIQAQSEGPCFWFGASMRCKFMWRFAVLMLAVLLVEAICIGVLVHMFGNPDAYRANWSRHRCIPAFLLAATE
jgi:hypothetical protein